MLHILLLILKWIGIVLAVFLLLVLLLINLGLFVPVRYRADASCQNDIGNICSRKKKKESRKKKSKFQKKKKKMIFRKKKRNRNF